MTKFARAGDLERRDILDIDVSIGSAREFDPDRLTYVAEAEWTLTTKKAQICHARPPIFD